MQITALATLTRYVDAFNRRDAKLARGLFDEDVVFLPLMAYLREPAEPYRGLDDMESFFADLNDLPNPPTLVAPQVVESRDGVILLSTLRTRGEDGPVDHPVSTLFRLRRGRIVTAQSYCSIETARVALGLAHAGSPSLRRLAGPARRRRP